MATTGQLGLTLITSGGTNLSVPVNALMNAVDEGLGIHAYDWRENACIYGVELAAGAGLTLNVNLTTPAGTAVLWQKGQQYIVTAGTTVTLSDDSLNYVFYDNARSGNPFYAQLSSVPAGTADVIVGCALAASAAISAAYTRNFSAGGWGEWINNAGITADVGQLACADLSNSHKYVLAAQANLARGIGVVMGQTVNGRWGGVQYSGVGVMQITGTVAVGDLLGTSHLLGVGTALSSPNAGAAIAKALVSKAAGAGTALIPVLLLGGGSGGGGTTVNVGTSVVSEQNYGANSAVGVSALYARADHTHGTVGIPSHNSLTGLTQDDHTQYLLASGSRAIVGNIGMVAGMSIDGRDPSADGGKLDTHTLGTANPHQTSHDQVLTKGTVSYANLTTLTDTSNADALHGHTTVGTAAAAASVTAMNDFGLTSVVGIATQYARQDHRHSTTNVGSAVFNFDVGNEAGPGPRNRGFENDNNGDGTPDYWAYAMSGAPSPGMEFRQVLSGTASVYLPLGLSAGTTTTNVTSTDFIPVNPNEVYEFRAWGSSDNANAQLSCAVVCFDGGKTQISNAIFFDATAIPGTNYLRATHRITGEANTGNRFRPGTRFVKLRVRSFLGAGPGGGSLFVDDFSFERIRTWAGTSQIAASQSSAAVADTNIRTNDIITITPLDVGGQSGQSYLYVSSINNLASFVVSWLGDYYGAVGINEARAATALNFTYMVHRP